MDIRDPEYTFEEQSLDTQGDQSTLTKETGEIEYVLEVYEYAPYERHAQWTKIMIVVIMLLSALAFWIDGWGSVTMLLAFLVLGAIYVKTHNMSDSTVRTRAAIAKYGLLFAGKMYPYAKMSGYYFLFFPEYITLNCKLEGKFSALVTLYLKKDEDIERIREVLEGKVTEDFDAQENIVQKVIRLLQL